MYVILILYICTYIRTYIYNTYNILYILYICIFTYVHIYNIYYIYAHILNMYICMYIVYCIYIYIYIYTYIYLYIFIYIYIYICDFFLFTLRINWLLIKRKGIRKILTPVFFVGWDAKCSCFIYSNMFQ